MEVSTPSQACFTRETGESGPLFGNFAVVGRRKSLFSGALIGPNSLLFFALIACSFEICAAHRRSLVLQQHTSLLVPCAYGKLNVKLYRTTPKPETHITRQVVEKETALWREYRAPKKSIQAAQRPHHPPHDSKQHNY